MFTPKITIVIPVLNEEKRLPTLLDSIKNQVYNHDNLEVLVVDGGSTDNTKKVVSEYGYRVVHNPWKLGDVGSVVGFNAAQGEIVILTAADTALTKMDFVAQVDRVFESEKDVVIGFCAVDTDPVDKKNSFITQYINLGTDPFNLFVYGREYCYYPELNKTVKPLRETVDAQIYKFSIENHPLLAVAQGFVIHKKRLPDGFLELTSGCDVLPVLKMISTGVIFAYIKNQTIKHYIFDSAFHFFKKMDKKIGLAFQNPDKWGFQKRSAFLNRSRRIKKYLFVPYAFFVLPAIIHALFLYKKSKRVEFIIHPFLSFVVLIFIVKQFFKKIFFQLFR